MIDTPAAPSTRTRQSKVALILASLSLVISLGSCGLAGFVAMAADIDLLPLQSKPTEVNAAAVEAVAHVTLPPGTVFLGAAYSKGLETHLWAKFRIPRTGLDAFVAGGKFTAPSTPGLRAVTAVPENMGVGSLWDPDTAKSVSGIDEHQPVADGMSRAVMFNLDVPDVITVYLYAMRG